MTNIILALLKYYRSKSSFLSFCAGYRWHYVCNDVSIWFAYKWSKMLTKKLAPCLKRFSIFQLTKYHQKISVFTICPRDPQKWTIAPALKPPLQTPFSSCYVYRRSLRITITSIQCVPKERKKTDPWNKGMLWRSAVVYDCSHTFIVKYGHYALNDTLLTFLQSCITKQHCFQNWMSKFICSTLRKACSNSYNN